MSTNPKEMLDSRSQRNSIRTFADHSHRTTQSEFPFSVPSQLELKPLREYQSHCLSILNDIHTDLTRLEIDPGNPAILSKINAQLGHICQDADSWGFHSLCSLAMGLQEFLLRSGGRFGSTRLWIAVNQSLSMMSALVDQCEADFSRRLAVADVLHCLNEPDGAAEAL